MPVKVCERQVPSAIRLWFGPSPGLLPRTVIAGPSRTKVHHGDADQTFIHGSLRHTFPVSCRILRAPCKMHELLVEIARKELV